MASPEDNNEAISIAGSKHLYRSPQLLTPEAHADLGFVNAERPFDFVRNTVAVPLTTAEFSEAAKDYPIVFSNVENPVALAVMGLPESDNLFVSDDGTWDEDAYLPGYLRCYPFAFVPQGDDRLALVVDTEASSVGENPEIPFFIDGEPSPRTAEFIEYCGKFEAARRETQQFCRELEKLELLSPQRVTRDQGSDEETPIADFVGIDHRKVASLADEDIIRLHHSGALHLMYLQLSSIDNWRRFVVRAARGR
jgi:hypothetical protein